LREKPYGVDFSMFAEWPLHDVTLQRFEKGQVAEPFLELRDFDMHTCTPTPRVLTGSIRATERTTAYGLCGWFNANLGNGIDIRTGPRDPRTHWGQLYFPLPFPLEIAAGQVVTATIRPIVRPDQSRTLWSWSLATEGQALEMDDFLHEAWLRTRPQSAR